MNYNDKAQRIVALGIGLHQHFSEGHRDAGDWYGYDHTGGTAKDFCNDWRVVGALMEKCSHIDAYWDDTGWSCDVVGTFAQRGIGKHDGMVQRSSLREAIVDACLDALEDE